MPDAPVATTPEPTYTIKFKRLKRHLKIMWTQSTAGGPTSASWEAKLSLPQWESVRQVLKKEAQYWPGAFEIDVGSLTRHALGALIEMGAVTHKGKDVPCSDTAWTHFYSWVGVRGTCHVDAYILTAFGKQFIDELPECPAREDWPAKPSRPALSRENIRLTGPQKRVLAEWLKKRSKALLIGGTAAEEDWWVAYDHYPKNQHRVPVEDGAHRARRLRHGHDRRQAHPRPREQPRRRAGVPHDHPRRARSEQRLMTSGPRAEGIWRCAECSKAHPRRRSLHLAARSRGR